VAEVRKLRSALISYVGENSLTGYWANLFVVSAADTGFAVAILKNKKAQTFSLPFQV